MDFGNGFGDGDDMSHLARDGNYKAIKEAISQESPSVARSMEKMSDSMSAAIGIVSNHLSKEASEKPENVIPLALEIFRASREESDGVEEIVDSMLVGDGEESE